MKPYGIRLSIIASLLLAVNSTALAQENLILNGSFEKFSIDKDKGKWKLVQFDNWSGAGEVWNHDIGRVATDGIYKAELDTGRNAVNSLTQSVTTIEGEKYLFALSAYARKDGTSSFELVVDGEVLATITPSKYWKKYGVEFTGKGTQQSLTIKEVASEDDGRGAIIDDVVLLADVTLDELKDKTRAKYDIIEPTGIDQILEIIDNDRVLHSKIDEGDIAKAKDASSKMNELIKEAISVNGLANDGTISVSDVLEINLYLVEKYADIWADLRLDYTKIEKKTEIKAMNKRAIPNIWGKIYNLGLPSTNSGKNSTDIDEKKSRSFRTLGYYLSTVTQQDMDELNNPDYTEVSGTTGTRLDMITNVILSDRGLLRKVPTRDLREGARTANEMNKLIVDGIKANGLANDGSLSTADIRTLNSYLVTNYAEKWAELHGNDEDNEETGYHSVQSDGATTRIFGRNVMNTIADGIYHLGYETNLANKLVNEDGNANQTFENVAWWLDISLKEDIASGKFTNPDYKEVVGDSGTSLDSIIHYIYNDEGLIRKVSIDDIREGARTANEMNKLIVNAIKTTGVATDNYISTEDVKTLNQYLVTNHAQEWAELHGDDEDNEETGYHRIQNDGAVGILEGRNTINNLADGIYHLGFATTYEKNLVNEDGNKNVTFSNVSYWLNKYLKNDYSKGVFR